MSLQTYLDILKNTQIYFNGIGTPHKGNQVATTFITNLT